MRTLLGGLLIGLLVTGSAVWAQEEEEPGSERLGAEEAEVKEAKEEAKEDAKEEESWIPGSFSGNVALYTDYSFRGISQTNRHLALQGGIDWAHESGLFVGLWGSSVNFGNAFLEQDFYGGYAGAIDDFSYSVQAVFFFYPADQIFNYWEFVGKMGYDFGVLSASTGLIGSPDYFGTLGTGIYIPFGIAVPLPLPEEVTKYFGASVDGNAGWTHTEDILFEAHTQHYWDWNMGLVVSLPVNLALDFRYVGTSNTEGITNGDADSRFVFGAKYSF